MTTATRERVLTIPIQALTVRQKGDWRSRRRAVQAASAPDPAAEKAAQERDTGSFCCRKGQVLFREVETGITGATDIEVLGGLKEGRGDRHRKLPGYTYYTE